MYILSMAAQATVNLLLWTSCLVLPIEYDHLPSAQIMLLADLQGRYGGVLSATEFD